MKEVTYYTNKTGERFCIFELEEIYFGADKYGNIHYTFKQYEVFEQWLKENFEELTRYVEDPRERARNSVYATGNRWAIENWNATH
jgi:hypothetical protein